jgi:hypothetical protein
MTQTSRLERLRTKWGLTSTRQVVLVCIVFSLAGFGVTQLRPPLWHLFGFTPETPVWIKTVTYLACIFPAYQLFLLLFGALLGQFGFFWAKQKKLVALFSGQKSVGSD